MEGKHYNALGAFIFAGGFTLGVSKHFNVLAHFEDSNYGVATFTHNFKDIPVYKPYNNWPIHEYAHMVDFIYCNPPCAVWSQIGKSFGNMHAWKDDERIDCVKKSFSLLEDLEPKIWCFESVTNAFHRGKEFIEELSDEANMLGYSCTYLLHNTKDFNVPQNRQRFFFIAHRVELDLVKPNNQIITALEALSKIKFDEKDVKRDGNTHAVMEYYLPGDSSDMVDRRNPGLFSVYNKPAFGIKRLRPNLPSYVIAGYSMIHPVESRFLSNAEMAALCGYPESYEFIGGVSTKSAQIARGVCPPMGEYLAGQVKNALDKNIPITKPENVTVNWL